MTDREKLDKSIGCPYAEFQEEADREEKLELIICNLIEAIDSAEEHGLELTDYMKQVRKIAIEEVSK